jgi:hypothetical protein
MATLDPGNASVTFELMVKKLGQLPVCEVQ